MNDINMLIEQRAGGSNCIQLSPELQMFYDTIVKSNQRNNKFKRDQLTEIKSVDAATENEILGNGIVGRNYPGTVNIRKKCSVVKKLLNQYDYLPLEDQEKARSVKDMLSAELIHLKKMSETENIEKIRKRRQILREQRLLKPVFKREDTNQPANDEREKRDFSSSFLKLIKTVAEIKSYADPE